MCSPWLWHRSDLLDHLFAPRPVLGSGAGFEVVVTEGSSLGTQGVPAWMDPSLGGGPLSQTLWCEDSQVITLQAMALWSWDEAIGSCSLAAAACFGLSRTRPVND